MQSLVQYQQLKDSAGEALCLNNLGALHLARNESEAARVHLRQGLAICERDGIVSTSGFILANLTEVAMKTGDLADAETYAARAVEVANAIGNRSVLSWVTIKRASLAAQRGNIDSARHALADGLGIAIELGVPSLHLRRWIASRRSSKRKMKRVRPPSPCLCGPPSESQRDAPRCAPPATRRICQQVTARTRIGQDWNLKICSIASSSKAKLRMRR